MLSVAKLLVLKNEILTDPTGLGLNGTDEEVAFKLNTVPTSGSSGFEVTHSTITGAELACVIDPTEFGNLAANVRQYVSMVVCAPGNLTGSMVQNSLGSIFTNVGSPNTRAAIINALKKTVSRAIKLIGQSVTPSDVADARIQG